MTAQGVLLVTAVVWAVSLIRPVRWRALVAALPLPMTVALLATGRPVDGTQLVGVVGLNLFFGVVALTHHRFRWPILLADLTGVAGYVALAAALGPVALPFGPTVAATVALWLLAMLALRRLPGPDPPADPADPPRDPPVGAADPAREANTLPADPLRDPAVTTAAAVRHAATGGGGRRPAGHGARVPAVARLLLILAGAVLTGLLGQVLRGLVVTFPYAGVLVAVEVRRDLPAFCRHFARNSLALLGFLVGVRLGQDASVAVSLVVGWVGFGLVAAALHLPRYERGKRYSATRSITGSVVMPRDSDGKR
ncbi:hypothetical protein KIF24_09010 [Micromonospora sp. Llam7]|uniref:hypothetical protein n=1 Tax=Micromonospora tarapacensis TaxID=2835305 RepID=UPI001C833053|nr:hypothetical protein [Micromonospora tarapacensis]MBX7266144.1 hypothetical protein [Micromonospora tarapacensis]